MSVMNLISFNIFNVEFLNISVVVFVVWIFIIGVVIILVTIVIRVLFKYRKFYDVILKKLGIFVFILNFFFI